jgi:hypothetical protein
LSLSDTKQVDEISNQRALLAQQGIIFETWDASEAGKLSELLKSHPELVDDFFLRDWVRIFNGQEAAETLGERLDGKNLAELRTQLKEIYSTLFHRNDQGIRLSASRTIPLLDRYVIPDVIEKREVSTRDAITGENSALSESNQQSGERQQTQSKSSGQRSVQEIRMPLGEWFARHNRSVLLGEPGYGKSAFLRIVVLQLLNGLDKPLSLPWQSVLPVWISFGGFSSAIQEQHNLSIEDYFEQWLHLHGAEHIRPLFRRAVRHGEILLLVDGLDEGLNTNDGLVRSHVAKNATNSIFDRWRLPQHLMAAIARCNRSLTAQDNEKKVSIGAGFPSVSWFRYAAARMILIPAAFK